jgi:ATP-binding cassette subfamily B protein
LTHVPVDPAGAAVPSRPDRRNGNGRDITHFKDSVLLVWRASPRWMLLAMAIMLLQSAFPPLMLLVFKHIMDAVGAGYTAGAQVQISHVMWLVALAAAVAMGDAAVRAVAGVVAEVQTQLVSDRVHELLLSKSALLELAYYENHEYHDTFHRAQQEAPQRVLHLVTSLNQVTRATATLSGMLVLLLFFDWILILLMLALVVPAVCIRASHEKDQHRRHERTTPMERQASYFRSLLTRIEPAKEIRLFELGAYLLRRFRALRAEVGRERMSMARRRAQIEFITQFMPEIAIFGCLALLAYRGMQGSVSLGGVVVYFWALQWTRSLLNETLGGLVSIYKDNLFLSSLHRFLGLELHVSEPEHPVPVPRPLASAITIENLSFRYAGKSTNALDEVNLVIRAGEKIALVGENGSGKTTLVKLLCRLYDPTHGEIRLDGISLRSFETACLRREISAVFQDYVCYELTAAENIALANAGDDIDEVRVRAAAARSGVHDTIMRLPLGYATQLGQRFEGGTELSIGEWQKIALARAFTRNAQILILDEPTSALDAEAEHEVFQRFFELAEGRTAILISHRLSTVRMADRIYVLDRGRIVESGSHDELMSRGGKYSWLFSIQAQPYLDAR